jgi:hypothetical protein
MGLVPAVAQQPGAPPQDQQREAMRAENRALLMRQWDPLLQKAQMVEIFYVCHLVTENVLVRMALNSLAIEMRDEQFALGLADGATVQPGIAARKAANEGLQRATPAFCSEKTASLAPADRAAIRQLVYSLAYLH